MTEVGFQTSGTSGKAKCIVRTEASLQADAAALVRQFPEFWATHLPVVATIPRDHMYGALWRVRAPALANSPVDAETILSEEGLIAAAARYGRFLLVTTPSFLEKLLEQPNVSALKGSIAGVVTSGSLLRSAAAPRSDPPQRKTAERVFLRRSRFHLRRESGLFRRRVQHPVAPYG